MLFSSIPFLYYFLPLVLAVYFLVPRGLKNAVLFASSLLFYAWGEPRFCLFMLLSILQGYVFGRLIEKNAENRKWSKIFLTASVLLSLGLLGYCKYADFFISSLNAVTGLSLKLLRVALPIGISFYTFQILSYTVDVAGKAMQPDFESVIERKIHAWFNYMEGVMHTGQRNQFRIRISKEAYEKGLRLTHFAEVLYHMITDEFEAVVDKCEVHLITDPVKATAFLNDVAIPRYNMRDDRLASMTDESVPVFYSCIMCQAFSPSHVCIVTPERLGLCGAVSWLDAKATNELDPQGPCQVVTKERCIDERTGRYEDVDEAVAEYSHGALEHVTLYSLLEDPMTSCGCFECICGIEPVSMGVVITMREYAGMTPLGMTFSEMASMTGGGVQTPGFMGHGKHYIASHKFLKAEGGLGRLVWLPKDLKDQIRDKMNETAKDLSGIENFADMVADETTCASGDPEELLNFLTEKGHPVLSMEPFDM